MNFRHSLFRVRFGKKPKCHPCLGHGIRKSAAFEDQALAQGGSAAFEDQALAQGKSAAFEDQALAQGGSTRDFLHRNGSPFLDETIFEHLPTAGRFSLASRQFGFVIRKA